MLVEFALVLPLLMLITVIILDFGRAINYWIDGTHLASEGARLAAVDRVPGGDLATYLRDHADTAELKNGGTSSVPNPLTVCVDFPEGPEVGNPVTVSVSTTYNWLPILDDNGGLPSSEIRGEATMRLEREPSYGAGCS